MISNVVIVQMRLSATGGSMEAPGRGEEDSSSCADLPRLTISGVMVRPKHTNNEEIRWSGRRGFHP